MCSFQHKHIMAERSVLMKNIKHPFLVGLHYSFQTTDKLYFVLDYVNGGEVSSNPTTPPKISPEYWSMFGRDVDRCLSVFSPAVLPSPEREDLPGAQSQVLRCWNCKCTWLPPLPAHCVQVMTDPTLPPSVFSVDMTCAEHGSNYFFFFTGTWSLRTSCWTHRATLSSQTLDSAKKVSRPITQQQPSAGRLRYKTNLQTFKQPHYQYRNYSCWTVGWLSLVAFLTVFGSWGSPEAGVRPHSRLVVSGIGALRDALWTCKWNVWLCASWYNYTTCWYIK